jgi:hypothetical protein
MYMLASNGSSNQTVYQYSGSDANWTAVTGSNTQVFQLISGSGALYMVASNGGSPSVWLYSGSGTKWTNLTGAGLQQALGAWQPELDHPIAGASYSPVNGTLFGPSGPCYLDVQQGQAADCWLLASLAEVAARYPQDIQNMFIYDGSTIEDGSTVGVYSVRFYTTSGVAEYVTVDTELPGGGSIYDQPVGGSGAVNGSSSPVLWVALAEKAYAEANGQGFVTSGNVYSNSYPALNYGDTKWALQAITGKPAHDYNLNTSDVVSAWNAGDLVTLCTGTPASTYIVGNHCYALVNYDSSSNLPFEVFNPWGTDANGWAPGQANNIYGLFVANAVFLSQNFAIEAFGNGATPANYSLEFSTGATASRNHKDDGRLLAEASGETPIFGAKDQLLQQSFRTGAAVDRHDGHFAWSPQQMTDMVFADGLQDFLSNI